MPIISIIMSVYNEAQTLARCLDSIICQTYTNWEFIIINDCSTDGTLAILTDYALIDRRIIVLNNEKNLGLAASLNRALSLAKGPYIARMDGDDISLPDRLLTQLEYMLKHPEVDVLGSGALDINKKGEVVREVRPRRLHHDLVRNIYKENPFFHSSVMCKHSFYLSMGGYNESLMRCQDYDLWLRGCQNYLYHNLDVPLICYNRPETPTLKSTFYASSVIFRALARDKCLISKGWFVSRPILAYLLTKVTHLKYSRACNG